MGGSVGAQRESSFPKLADLRLANVSRHLHGTVAGKKEGGLISELRQQVRHPKGTCLSVINCDDDIAIWKRFSRTESRLKLFEPLDGIALRLEKLKLRSEALFADNIPLRGTPVLNRVVDEAGKLLVGSHWKINLPSQLEERPPPFLGGQPMCPACRSES